MLSSTREEIQEDFDALRAAVSRILRHSYDALTTPERLVLLERLEQETRRLRVPGHQLINQLAEQAPPEDLGAKLSHALADRLRITRGDATRRIAEAADLGPRGALTGEVLTPLLTATAAAQRAGDIGVGHVQVIRRFFNRLPVGWTSTRARSPRSIWPSWPPSSGPIRSPIWPTGLLTASIPTAPTPTRFAPAAAA